MPRSPTPAESLYLAFRNEQLQGVAVDRRLSSATHVAAGASICTIVTLRHIDVAPAFQNDEGLSNGLAFGAQSRGLSARCLRFAARLATEPRKTRLRLVGQPYRAGLGTRRVAFKVSAFYIASSSAKLSLAQFEFEPTFLRLTAFSVRSE